MWMKLFYLSFIYATTLLCCDGRVNDSRLLNALRTNRDSNCPTSSLINTKFDQILDYPMDIFDKNQYESAGNYSNMDSALYNCTSSERDNNPWHKCSTQTTCPVSSQNVDVFVNKSISLWQGLHSLCNLQKVLLNPEEIINIVVLGGSVTAGSASFGCCCNKELDSKCIPPADSKQKWCGRDDISYLCRWHDFLLRWMDALGEARIQRVDAFEGGATSPYMAEKLGPILHSYDIKQLTSKDIVFIDHSVNDGMSFSSKIRHNTLDQGLESLILRILHLSEPGSWPTIILLEQWPYVSARIIRDNIPPVDGSSRPFDYIHAYERIAREYSLPLWSYRDVVWSPEAYSSNMSSFISYLRFEHNNNFASQHPPWYINLFYADLIASSLSREILDCSARQRSQISMNISAWMLNHHLKEDVIHCREDIPHLIDMSAANVLHNPSHNIGSYVTNSTSAWGVVEERHGKVGWVDEIDEGNCTNFYSSIFFPIPSNSNKTSPSIDPGSYMLRIHYLRTYFNAGKVTVYLCGNKITTLDALWEDHETYKYSYNDIYTLEYNARGVDDICNRNKAPQRLEFRHSCVSDPIPARNRNKFKIVSVRLCSV